MADSLRSEAYRSVIQNLREVREEAGIHQAVLSAKLGKADNYISRIETAERRIGIVEIVVIARAMGMEPTELFGRIVRDIPATSE